MDIRKFFGGGSKKSIPSTTTTAAKTNASGSSSSSGSGKRDSLGDCETSFSQSSPPIRRESLSSPRNEKRDREQEMETSKTAVKNRDDIAENDDDKEDEEGDYYFEQARKRRAVARGTGNGDSAGNSRISSGGAGRRRRVIHDEDDDDVDEEKVMVVDDDDDDEFHPNANNADDESDDDDEKPVRQQPQKKKTSPSKKRQLPPVSSSPPKRTSPRKLPASSSTKKQSAAERPTSSWSMQKTSSLPPPANPPKYHPPSSKLTTHIPFLGTATLKGDGITDNINNDNNINSTNNSNKITLPHATIHDLPRLSKTENFLSTFTDDATITPHCLDGLTFVFTGILSTNDAHTSQTNAQVALSSPSKGDYYTNRRYDCSASSSDELSRDTAVDIIKCLGGRVTTMVSGKTDYVICGNILEDGRNVIEGSKYKKCVELWEAWSAKWRKEYSINDGGDAVDTTPKTSSSTKKKKGGGTLTKPKKDQDPNTLVETIHGIHEFYGLVVYLSEWKKSTLSESERMELDARQMQRGGGAANRNTKEADADDGKPLASLSTAKAAASNPYQSSAVPSNPYAKKTPVANPYAKALTATTATNPYAKSPSTSVAVSNPYTKKSLPSNPYTTSSATATTAASFSAPTPHQPSLHPGSGKELGANSLWADKYAPSNTSEILGNSDSINKLSRWLSSWEKIFNAPKKQKGGNNSGPNGPWRAALLSGPPGIGKLNDHSRMNILQCNTVDRNSLTAKCVCGHNNINAQEKPPLPHW